MTQQVQREIIVFAVGAVGFVRAVYPKPIIEWRSRKPYQNQLIARICYAGFGVFCLLIWYGIRAEALHH